MPIYLVQSGVESVSRNNCHTPVKELFPDDHVCRVIDAFVDRLDIAGLGFERAEAAETGRPGYDPRDLLKLYLYDYLQQIRSSRRLESECRRNIELIKLVVSENDGRRHDSEMEPQGRGSVSPLRTRRRNRAPGLRKTGEGRTQGTLFPGGRPATTLLSRQLPRADRASGLLLDSVA